MFFVELELFSCTVTGGASLQLTTAAADKLSRPVLLACALHAHACTCVPQQIAAWTQAPCIVITHGAAHVPCLQAAWHCSTSMLHPNARWTSHQVEHTQLLQLFFASSLCQGRSMWLGHDELALQSAHPHCIRIPQNAVAAMLRRPRCNSWFRGQVQDSTNELRTSAPGRGPPHPCSHHSLAANDNRPRKQIHWH